MTSVESILLELARYTIVTAVDVVRTVDTRRAALTASRRAATRRVSALMSASI